MTWNSGLTNLQELLAYLYDDMGKSRQLLAIAQVPTTRISFAAAASANWFNILEEADRRGLVSNIVRVASDEFPNRRQALEEAEQEYLAAAQPTPAPEPVDARERFSGFREKMGLVDALLACPTISNRQTRDTVIDSLPTQIKGNIQRSSADRVDVTNLVNTVLNYRDGLPELVERVRAFEGDSLPMQKLDQLVG